MPVSEGASVVRYDYAADAWEGPPEKAIGWWKSQVPDHSSRKMHWVPNDVMLNYFEQIAENPEKLDVRDVLTLLMIRRRVLRMEEADDADEAQASRRLAFMPEERTDLSRSRRHAAGRARGSDSE